MPIEFLCPSCQQQLRVPDAAAGKNARCPGCSTIAKVPETSQPPAANPLSPPAQPGFNFGPPEPKPSAPSGGSFGAPPSNSFGAPPPGNPFGDSLSEGYGGATYGSSPFGTTAAGGGAGTINPYASPAATFGEAAGSSGALGNQLVDFGTVFNYAFRVWQENLGLLVGSTFVAFIINIVSDFAGNLLVGILSEVGEPLIVLPMIVIVQLAKIVLQVFVGIGQVQISLKLGRQQRAEFGDLFGGGSRLLPIIGLLILIGIIVYLPLIIVLLVAGGVVGAAGGGGELAALLIGCVFLMWVAATIVFGLYFWPAYYLVVDNRSGVLESFGRAMSISAGNKVSIFVLAIVAFLILILGVLALCVGVFFALPLAGLMFAVAYLMMSKQIPAYPNYQR